MSHSASIRRPALISFTVAAIAASWWGCAAGSNQQPPSTTQGTGGTGGTGVTTVTIDGGDMDDAGPCVYTTAAAHHVPLDLMFVIDQSVNLAGTDWTTITNALKTFFVDPASTDIGAGLLFFPYSPYDCDLAHYETLTVPLDVLPKNAFALTNAIPAEAQGLGTPMRPALHGALMQATAWQDANPTHRVAVVLASAGDLLPAVPGASDAHECGDTSPLTVWDKLGQLAGSALSYNGVRTFVVGVPGATIADLDEVAAAGGTTAAFDATNITQFSAQIAAIRNVGLGCEYAIPAPPNGQQLNYDKVNFSYAPNGTGAGTILPRAKDLADCSGQPGWYYNSNGAPTEIILCPASCSAVEADDSAAVSVLFGCTSVTR